MNAAPGQEPTGRLTLEPGALSRIRPSEEVTRWVSDDPAVATVSDVDVLRGTPGGEVRAVGRGTTRVRGYGVDGEVCVDVAVEVLHREHAVEVAAGQRAPLPDVGQLGQCRISPARVARIEGDGQVSGLMPGVALIRAELTGGGQREILVYVSGQVEVACGGRLDVSEFFGVPVTAWRSGSQSVAAVDGQGALVAGTEPRSTRITATLENGREFCINVRVTGDASGQLGEASSVASEAPSDTGLGSGPEYVPEPLTESSESPEPTTDAPAAVHEHEVDAHLATAEQAMRRGDWRQASAELQAAQVLAAVEPALQARVNSVRTRLEREARARGAARLSGVLQRILYGPLDDAASAGTEAAGLAPPHATLGAALSQLAEARANFEDTDLPPDTRQDELARATLAVWGCAVEHQAGSIMPALATFSVEYGLQQLAAPIADTLCGAAGVTLEEGVRHQLTTTFGQFGAAALGALLTRLSDPAAQAKRVEWALDLFCEMDAGRLGVALGRHWQEAPHGHQKVLVSRIAGLAKRVPGFYTKILAEVLRLPPRPRRLASALAQEAGPDATEKIACTCWARPADKQEKRAARTVLERLYRYDAASFR